MQKLSARIHTSTIRPFFVGILVGLLVSTVYYLVGFHPLQYIPVSFMSMELHTNSSSTNGTTSKVVPNVVHFIWFADDANRTFSFVNYVSILSAYKIQKPVIIKIHCNYLPSGDWWDQLWRDVPIRLLHRPRPVMIHEQPISHVYHAADVAKIEIMMEEGGIYLDMDVIVLKNMDPLRVFDATLGKEKPPKFIAGIMIGKPNATFFQLMHESYRNNYRSGDWDYNCARVPYLIYQLHQELLHVERYKLTTPDWIDRRSLWEELIDWQDLYVIHLMSHALDEQEMTRDAIKHLNTTFGEIMRFIYYDSSRLLD